MRGTHWEFRPGLAGTLAAIAGVPLLVALGFWQLDRAAQKEALYQSYVVRGRDAPVDINGAGPGAADAEYMQFRRVRVRGRFAPITVLLDNQVHEGDAGYDVYSPLQLPGGAPVLLVDRGWVAMGADRRSLPAIDTPADDIELSGVARLPSAPPITLGDTTPEELAPGVLRVQRIDLAGLAARYHWRLLPYDLRLDPASPAGFIRGWPMPGSGKERHLAYAFQWFAMAAAAVVLYLYLNLKRKAAP